MCYSPVAVRHKGNNYLSYVSCGQCEECKTLHINKLTNRFIQEAKKSKAVYVVTFTIAPEEYGEYCWKENQIPYFQKIFKCMRKQKIKFKYYMVAENGERKGRIHLHAIFFAEETDTINFYNILKRYYKLGFIQVEKLRHFGGYKYVLGYLKKAPLFTLCSKGIGKLKDQELLNYCKHERYIPKYYLDSLKKIIGEAEYIKWNNKRTELSNDELLYRFDALKNSEKQRLNREKRGLDKKAIFK